MMNSTGFKPRNNAFALTLEMRAATISVKIISPYAHAEWQLKIATM